MSGPVKRVTHTFPIPREVRPYMEGNSTEVTWSFIDPTDALVRLLVNSPCRFVIVTLQCHILHISRNIFTSLRAICLWSRSSES